MNFKRLLSIAALSVSCLSHAEETSRPALNSLKPLNNVRVSMQRMLKSTDERYFLSIYAGIAQPHGTLYDLSENKNIELRGTQKGHDLDLKALQIDSLEKHDIAQIMGNLNVNSGVLKSNLIDQAGTNHLVQFEPAFKVENKPLFTFKFYGVKADTEAQEQLLTRVDVIDKTNNTVAQTLTGFSAYPNSIGYLDINFDGHYDVILSDLSQDRKVTDKRYIYWMYNPKTTKYQRSPQLEKIVGFPKLQGEKQQIDFGGQRYQVNQGLLQKIE
ncbi:hypothetical protein AMD27_13500 [Acinetobacter sp. TGL-Y2]|uniref:XAC2610-related protein n=1 Tax=Acinetobacter sp. TGL-Y2 TaxID=1407071 RepID=UPI0007A663DE|nr:hypothetical protein [Acinetobacter sp. TGL-Y2]AMW80425.1 hypothetical protein AMD27_13500 [Acinetobacter sp. TGL-Y2]